MRFWIISDGRWIEIGKWEQPICKMGIKYICCLHCPLIKCFLTTIVPTYWTERFIFVFRHRWEIVTWSVKTSRNLFSMVFQTNEKIYNFRKIQHVKKLLWLGWTRNIVSSQEGSIFTTRRFIVKHKVMFECKSAWKHFKRRRETWIVKA